MMFTSSRLCPTFPTVKVALATAPGAAVMGVGGEVTNKSDADPPLAASAGPEVLTNTGNTTQRTVARLTTNLAAPRRTPLKARDLATVIPLFLVLLQ
jgi:hypothetical protein